MGNTVEVKKYKSEHDFEKDAERMIKQGWHIEGQSTRTKNFSLTGWGFMTNKGITTVTWIKGPIPGGVTLVLVSAPAEKDARKRVNHALYVAEGLIAQGLKGPTSSLGIRERMERMNELAKLVRAASEGTPQIIGEYEPERVESLSTELSQARATIEIRPPTLSPPTDGSNHAESAVTKLKQLAELRTAGIVTEQEFESKKAQLLSQL
jgi:hypothetical protein